jgi:hypothetical protein
MNIIANGINIRISAREKSWGIDDLQDSSVNPYVIAKI